MPVKRISNSVRKFCGLIVFICFHSQMRLWDVFSLGHFQEPILLSEECNRVLVPVLYSTITEQFDGNLLGRREVSCHILGLQIATCTPMWQGLLLHQKAATYLKVSWEYRHHHDDSDNMLGNFVMCFFLIKEVGHPIKSPAFTPLQHCFCLSVIHTIMFCTSHF